MSINQLQLAYVKCHGLTQRFHALPHNTVCRAEAERAVVSYRQQSKDTIAQLEKEMEHARNWAKFIDLAWTEAVAQTGIAYPLKRKDHE